MQTNSGKPESVYILGKEWRILDKESDGAYGLCIERALEIHIGRDLSDELERDTVLHEILHAIDWTVGTKLTEKQVGTIASGLYAVLKENPNLVEYLCHIIPSRTKKKQRSPRKSNIS